MRPFEDLDVHECDYDVSCIALYEAIENKQWEHVRGFFECGKWPNYVFKSTFLSTRDPFPPKRQARTWVTKYKVHEKNEKVVAWTRLPLHAAIIYDAPVDIVEKLIELYPEALRAATAGTLLPLHLAIKHGSEDDILRVLLKSCEDAISPIMDGNGKFPSDIEGPRYDLQKTIEIHVQYASSILKHQHNNTLRKAQEAVEAQLNEREEFVKKRERRNEATKRACEKAQEKVDCWKKCIESAKEEKEAAKKDLAYQKSRMEIARIQNELDIAREDALLKQKAAATAAAASHSVIGNHWVSEKEFAKKDQIYQKSRKEVSRLESELKKATEEVNSRKQEADVAAAAAARAASSVASVASSKASRSVASSKASKSVASSKVSQSGPSSRCLSSRGSGSQEELISTRSRKSRNQREKSRKSRNRASPIRTIHVVHGVSPME